MFGDVAPFLSIALLAIPGMQVWVMESWVHAFQFGFWTGGIATGSLRGALFGGISGAAFYGIGEHFTALTGLPAGGVGHSLTHGVMGGLLAELQGGQFGHGFLAAGLTKAVMGRFTYHDGSAPAVLSRTAIAAIVGGTVSRITGGKFANGALTAAMAQLFNQETSNINARANRQEQLAHLVVRRMEDRIIYEYGDASVLVMNDVVSKGIPIVKMQTIEHVLDVSYAVGKQVQIISGYRTDSTAHREYGAIDVKIHGYNSEQIARALHRSGHFNRVSYYTKSPRLYSAHADYYNESGKNQGLFEDWIWQSN